MSLAVTPPAAPPSSTLNRCGSCRLFLWPTELTQPPEVGFCSSHGREQRADAVACPEWCRHVLRPVMKRVH